MRVLQVPVEPLTESSFAPFGCIVKEFHAAVPRLLVGEVVRNRMRVRRVSVIEWLSAHYDGEQIIVPCQATPTVFVVALPTPQPVPEAVRAFLSEGNEGVCLAMGVWHAFPIPVTVDHALYDNAQGSQWHKHTVEVHLPTQYGCLLQIALPTL